MKVANRDWRTPRCWSSRDCPNPSNRRLPAPQGHRSDDDRELVDQPGRQGPADGIGAAHHVHLPVAGCGLGLINRRSHAPGKNEVAARRLLVRVVGDDEERAQGFLPPQCPAG
jgi:hypothetical protein